MVLRCCAPTICFQPCYASVLYMGAEGPVLNGIQAVENQGIVPCTTAWCNKHHKISFIIPDDVADYSAYAAHMLALSKK
jgi:hypothetical protein